MESISQQPVEYLTTLEAAAYLKLSRQYLEVARQRADGTGPDFIKLARAVRYRRSELDPWMSAHDRTSGAPLRQGATR